MTQDERWQSKWQEVMTSIKTNKRNPSRYDARERGLYCNWLRHNKKLFNAGDLKDERMEMFKELQELSEKYKRVNQYQ